jgi:hypothetical protein
MFELRNAVESAIALTCSETITFEDLPQPIRNPASGIYLPDAAEAP